MPKYEVSLPFTGYVVVEVEALTRSAAIDAAFEVADLSNEDSVVEVQFHKHVTRGNVCSAVLNDAEAQEVK